MIREPLHTLTTADVQMLEEIRARPAVFDVFCGECRYILAAPGPGCCRYTPPRRSFWRRLFHRKET